MVKTPLLATLILLSVVTVLPGASASSYIVCDPSDTVCFEEAHGGSTGDCDTTYRWGRSELSSHSGPVDLSVEGGYDCNDGAARDDSTHSISVEAGLDLGPSVSASWTETTDERDTRPCRWYIQVLEQTEVIDCPANTSTAGELDWGELMPAELVDLLRSLEEP